MPLPWPLSSSHRVYLVLLKAREPSSEWFPSSREKGREAQNIGQSPQIPCQPLRSRRDCVERERSRQGTEHTTYPLLSLIFEKGTILSAGNSWGQADACGSGEQSSHITHLLQQKLPVGKRGPLLRVALLCFPGAMEL